MMSGKSVVKPSQKPVPVTDRDNESFWNRVNQGQFTFQRCRGCRRPQFYARSLCSHCKAADLAWESASGRGTIASFSIVHRAPLEAFQADVPYVLALVDLEEGIRFMCNVIRCDPNTVRIGDLVKVVFERREGSEQQIPQVEPI